MTRNIRRFIVGLIATALSTALLLCLIEGASSWYLALNSYIKITALRKKSVDLGLAERKHTQFDPYIGWVNKPGVKIKDFYRPGADMIINTQGFRNETDTNSSVSIGKHRLICSGDSFTLGYGVGNSQSWCATIASFSDNWDYINLGNGGYGIDQAYLLYMREGPKFQHNLHIFAFIDLDFERAETFSFSSYPKPLLRVIDHQLQTINTPLSPPIEREAAEFTLPNLNVLVDALSWGQLLKRNTNWFTRHQRFEYPLNIQTAQLTSEITKNLLLAAKESNSELVIVRLPMQNQYKNNKSTERRSQIAELIRSSGAHYVDLQERFDQLDESQIPGLFIQDGQVSYMSAAGHYSALGNSWVASELRNSIDALRHIKNE